MSPALIRLVAAPVSGTLGPDPSCGNAAQEDQVLPRGPCLERLPTEHLRENGELLEGCRHISLLYCTTLGTWTPPRRKGREEAGCRAS